MKPVTHTIISPSGRKYWAYSKSEAVYIRDTVGGIIIPVNGQTKAMRKIAQLINP